MNRNEAIEFLRKQSPAVFQGMPFNEPVEFDWSLVDGKFCRDGSTPICESDVWAQPVPLLQTKIETLLDMEFETEEKLLETIGSLWSKPAPVKTYWDGAEPLRVGHITVEGIIRWTTATAVCFESDTGIYTELKSTIKPHPFAKYTDEQREFLQSQIEAGVIKLC